jgi:hypothetical protein
MNTKDGQLVTKGYLPKLNMETIMKLILIAFVFAIMTLSFSRASCDIETLKKDALVPFSMPMKVDGYFTGTGIATFTDVIYPDYPVTIKDESYLILVMKVDIKFPHEEKPLKRKFMTIRPVDMASCTLGQFEMGDVFGSSVSEEKLP